MGRTSEARNQLLESATRLFYDRGYNAVGVKEICEDAGVLQGSFYYFFPSKRALLQEVIEVHAKRYREVLDGALKEDGSAVERVRRVFERIYQHHRSALAATGKMRGCAIGNLALELSPQDREVRDRLDRVFREWAVRLAEVLREASAVGDAPDIDPDKTATAIVAYLEGIAVLATTRNDPELFGLLAGSVDRLLRAEASRPGAVSEEKR